MTHTPAPPAPTASDSGLRLWLAISRQTGVPRDRYREAHRRYMKRLVASGAVFASGPAATAHGADPFGGITVLRTETELDARKIMDEEPYVKAGARTYDLIAWDIRHGNYASFR